MLRPAQAMEITQSHMTAFLHARNRFLPNGVTAWGMFHCRNGDVQTEVFERPERMCTTHLLRQRQGDIGWKTVPTDVRCDEVSEIIQCSFTERRSMDAVLLGPAVFWRIVVAPPASCGGEKVREIVSSVNLGLTSLGRLNAALRGIGRVERSPYVVVEDPALSVAFDFFRRNSCDLDWVKQQVYGRRLLHVPQAFPEHVPAFEEVLPRCNEES